MLLKDAWLLAAQQAGGGGKEGLTNYLERQANENPRAFITGLARIIPMQVDIKGGGKITIEIVRRFDGDNAKVIEAKPNGHLNGNGHKDPSAE